MRKRVDLNAAGIDPRNRFLPLIELSHRQTNKQTRIRQSLEPRYSRKAIFHLTVASVNQCTDLEESC